MDASALWILTGWTTLYCVVVAVIKYRSPSSKFLREAATLYLVLLGVHCWILSRRIPVESGWPNAASFPLIVSALLTLSAGGAFLANTLLRTTTDEADIRTHTASPSFRLPLLLVACSGYILSIPSIGFFPGSFFFFCFSSHLLGARRWSSILILGAVGLGACYVLFISLLGMSLPTGSLFQ